MSESRRQRQRERAAAVERDQTPVRSWWVKTRWAAIGVLAGLVTAGAILAAVPQFRQRLARGTPQLVVDRDVVDLGDVPLGRTVEVTFAIANAGDALLEVTGPPYVEAVAGC